MSGGNNGKVLTVSRKLAKILTDSRKSHHPVETLTQGATESQMCYFLWVTTIFFKAEYVLRLLI